MFTLSFKVFVFADALEDITCLSICRLLAAAQTSSLPALLSQTKKKFKNPRVSF